MIAVPILTMFWILGEELRGQGMTFMASDPPLKIA